MSSNTKEHIGKLTKSRRFKEILVLIATALLALVAGVGITVSVRPQGETGATETEVAPEFNIELSENQVPTEIQTVDGGVEVIQAPTVEIVDAEIVSEECPEGEECGQGQFIYAPTATPQEFSGYVMGNCFNTDGAYGAQCWDLGDMFWQNYAGRRLSTCGTGVASGIWNCKEENAGGEFELITDPQTLQAGDWLIFSSGQYGHVGMALGGYNNGYIALLGQNQGGGFCDGGGSATNVVNINLNSFTGAFRPKSYIKPESTPEPEPAPAVDECQVWEVVAGDTLGSIMQHCRGEIEWGESMNEYASHWYSTKLQRYLTVYDGWTSPIGYGLFAGDIIKYRG